VCASDERAAIDLGNRPAGHTPGGRVRKRHILGDRRDERLIGEKPAKRRRAIRGLVDHAPIHDVDGVRAYLPAIRRASRERTPRRRGHAPQLEVHRRCGAAAEGAHVERHAARVAHGERDRLERHVQLFCHRLRERRADVLSDFDLACERRHRTGGGDVEPGVHVCRQAIVGAPAAATFLTFESRADEQDEQAAAERLDEVASIEFESIPGIFQKLVAFDFNGHRPLPARPAA